MFCIQSFISIQMIYGEVLIVVQVKWWSSNGHTRDLISLIQTFNSSHHFDFLACSAFNSLTHDGLTRQDSYTYYKGHINHSRDLTHQFEISLG